jgi:hypothetical protein
MEVTNGTTQDCKYNVTGGTGTPIHPHSHPEIRADQAMHWPMLHAGSRLSLDVNSEGPWNVFFFIQGKAYSVTANSPGNHLTLLQRAGEFTVQID